MTNLSDIKGFNQYCGPGVLSAITGRSTDACAAVISAVTGAKVIKAVQMASLVEALKRIEFEAHEISAPGVTLYGCLSGLSHRDGFYIIGVPKHVIALEVKEKTIYLIDNHTKHTINAAASARLSQIVDKVYHVKPKIKPTKEDITKERKSYLKTQIDLTIRQIRLKEDLLFSLEQELNALEQESK